MTTTTAQRVATLRRLWSSANRRCNAAFHCQAPDREARVAAAYAVFARVDRLRRELPIGQRF